MRANASTRPTTGRIYFTDPRYGSRDGMELPESVYRIDAPGKAARILSQDAVSRPNGILVSPGDRFLYIADNNNSEPGGARKLVRFRLLSDGTVDVRSRRVIFDWRTGRGPDGLEMDQQGRLYVAAGRTAPRPPFETAEFPGGVYILSPEGRQLGLIPIPTDEVTNVAFGGSDWKTLYITAGGTLWSIRLTTPGRAPYTGQ
jgi:gluconolactonase